MAEKGLQLNSNNPYGHILLSNYWALKGNHAQSIKEAITAQNLDPLNPNTSSLLVTSYMLAGKYKKALEKYKEILELFPRYALAWNDIGIIYYLMNEKEKAKDSWKELHKIMGDN